MQIRPSRSDFRVDVQMTPMIDVVFQLLAFFILSFRVVMPEGDLAAKMPLEATGADLPDNFDLPVDVHLVAGEAGALSAIRISSAELRGLPELRTHIEALAADNAHLQVNLVCDTSLRYEHAVAALTAVSSKRLGNKIVPLARDVRLASPR